MNPKVNLKRQTVHAKCNGKCAYCGKDLPLDKMQIDHINPLWRGHSEEALKKWNVSRGTDDLENLLPSCRRCNIRKGTWSIDGFRKEITLQLHRLKRDNNGYRLALDFGLIQENSSPIVFYFETLNL